MIQVQNLSKHYGTTQALKGISFSISKGEIVGFLGPNGAGKTTLMRILTSYLTSTSGDVSIAGYNVVKNSLQVRQNIGYLPENPPLYGEMKVGDYLKFAGRLKGIKSQELKGRIEQILRECEINEVRNRPIASLSKGFKQRVGIAQAIIHNPKVLILDEPTSGLDPRQILQVRKLIKGLEQDRTVLLSTHILSEIEQIAHRVIILKEGKLVADDSLKTLLNSQDGTLEHIFLRLTA